MIMIKEEYIGQRGGHRAKDKRDDAFSHGIELTRKDNAKID